VYGASSLGLSRKWGVLMDIETILKQIDDIVAQMDDVNAALKRLIGE
jgi:hypothetical protein